MSIIEKSVAASPYLLCSTQYCESSTCTSDLAVGTESVLISVPVGMPSWADRKKWNFHRILIYTNRSTRSHKIREFCGYINDS